MAVELLLDHVAGSLRPHDIAAQEDLEALGPGPFMVSVTKPRSLPHNRFYFSIIVSMIKSGAPGNRGAIHNATKIKTGLVTMCQLPNGDFMAFPDSTAFNRMDQAEFNLWFPMAVTFWRSCGLWDYIAPDLRAKLEDGERQAA